MIVRPVEQLLLAGFQSRFSEVFECEAQICNAYDKVRVLAAAKGGKTLKYPYAFIRVTALGRSPDRYFTSLLSRRGLPFLVEELGNTAHTVRLLATDYQVEIEYRTNTFDLDRGGSALAFARRWAFARRHGYLKFNVNYGRVVLPISVDLDEQPQIPDRPSSVEQAPEYLVTANLQIKGWTSETHTGEVGVVQEVNVDVQHGQFWKFPNRS